MRLVVSPVLNWLYIPKVKAVVDHDDLFYSRCFYHRLLNLSDNVITESNAGVFDLLLLPYGPSSIRYVRFADEYGVFIRDQSAAHLRLLDLLSLLKTIPVLSGEHLHQCKRRRTIRYIQQHLEQYSQDKIHAGLSARVYRCLESYDDHAVQHDYSCNVFTPSVDLIEDCWVALNAFRKSMREICRNNGFRVY
jgi:hypothetical protein